MTASTEPDDGVFRRLRREHASLDALDLYARVVEQSSTPIHAEERIAGALDGVRQSLLDVTSRESTLHGWRVQALFEAIVASLGRVRLLKLEDAGEVYFSGADLRPPDFRIVGAGGEQFLVEVKNVFQKQPMDDYRLRRKDMAALRRYCAVVGVDQVKFAIYWARWNLWSLTDSSWFVDAGPGHLSLSMPEAMKGNEMGEVGDRTPGTEWPIGLTLYNDEATDRRLNEDGEAAFTIARAVYTVAGKEVTAPREQNIVHRLMLYGGWSEAHSVEIENNELVSTSFMFAPDDPPPTEQQFAMHNPLSSIYSAMFNAATVAETGDITALRLEVDPNALSSLIPDDYEGDVLRVWRFHLNAPRAADV